MNRVVGALLLLMLPLASAADARDPLAPQDATAAQDGVAATLLAFAEHDQRLTVPVALGAAGPFPFIIDTGAERTVVSRELAGTLGLAAGRPVTLTSMTERSVVDTVIVPQLSIATIGRQHRVVAPALEARHLGAAGLLGIDTLAAHQVVIDFDTGQMTVRPSQRRRSARPSAPDEIVVTARDQLGQLIVTDAWYGDTRIQVVLDTGSQVSMGNNALRQVVGKRLKDMRRISLTSVTGGKAEAEYTLIPRVRVGNVRFESLPVAFAEVAPFARFGLTRRPALLLGMDALRSFRQVEIDFPNRQLRFRMPRGNRGTVLD